MRYGRFFQPGSPTNKDTGDSLGKEAMTRIVETYATFDAEDGTMTTHVDEDGIRIRTSEGGLALTFAEFSQVAEEVAAYRRAAAAGSASDQTRSDPFKAWSTAPDGGGSPVRRHRRI